MKKFGGMCRFLKTWLDEMPPTSTMPLDFDRLSLLITGEGAENPRQGNTLSQIGMARRCGGRTGQGRIGCGLRMRVMLGTASRAKRSDKSKETFNS